MVHLLVQVQEAFGREVGNCLQYLTESQAWTPQRIVVYREPEQSCSMNTSSTITNNTAGTGDSTGGGKCSVFECKELGDRRSNVGLHTSMEECVAQYGACVLETGVVYAESDSALRKQELLAVFENIVYRHGKPDHRAKEGRGASGGDAGVDAATAASQFYSADFQDITTAKPKTSAIVKQVSINSPRVNMNTKGMFVL